MYLFWGLHTSIIFNTGSPEEACSCAPQVTQRGIIVQQWVVSSQTIITEKCPDQTEQMHKKELT